jgi:16S rRNA processing protein RimM
MNQNNITIGTIVATSGIKGYVRIKCSTESPRDIIEFSNVFDANVNNYKIKAIISVKGSIAVAQIEGITSIEMAEKLIGIDLMTKKSELTSADDGDFYYADLIGMEVYFEDETKVGNVIDVMNYGASDIIEVGGLEDGKTTMYPFVEDFIVDVNLDEKKIIIRKPEIF